MTGKPASAEDHFRQGLAAAQRGEWPAAKRELQAAVALQPCWSAAWNNLANVHRRLGEAVDAEACLLRAVVFAPNDSDYSLNLGHFYRDTQRLLPAEACYRNSLRINAANIPALKALGDLLVQLGKVADAVEMWEQWLKLDPSAVEPLNQLGMVYREREEFAKAEALWSQAIERRPQDPAAFGNLGQLLQEQGEEQRARETYGAGAGRHPTAALRILEATVLPVILQSESQIELCRQALSNNLDQLIADQVKIDTARESLPTLFYLVYHGLNDRPLMEKMSRLSTGSTADELQRRPRGKRLRIGVLSHFLRDHTIGRLNIGLIEQLSRAQFEVFAIACQPAADPLTQRIQRSADHYVVLSANVASALKCLREMDLDVLLYADLGMIPFTYTLACNRVAPVQCTTWGHPVTSGLPTIDYFLSSQALEPEGAEEFYTEKLICLPRLSVCYDPPLPANPKATRAAFGFHASAHLYGCPQTLFKFHPQFDSVLASILRQDPSGVLVLLAGRHPQWQAKLVARWQQTMPDVLPRIRFLPKLARCQFLDLLQVCDVILDPMVFGGGNTSYEAFGLGKPIVTCPTPFLRSRLTAAMYSQMGLSQRVACSAEEYVEQAVRLGTDQALRADWSSAIKSQAGELFGDQRTIREMETVISELVMNGTGSVAG